MFGSIKRFTEVFCELRGSVTFNLAGYLLRNTSRYISLHYDLCVSKYSFNNFTKLSGKSLTSYFSVAQIRTFSQEFTVF